MGNQFISQEMIQSVVSAQRQFQNSIRAHVQLSNLDKEMDRAYQRIQIEQNEELIKLLKEKKGKNKEIINNLDNDIESLIPGIGEVFLHYPDFKKDLSLLLQNDFVRIFNDKLVNNKTKKFLAEYFGNLPQKNNKIKWEMVEALFHIKDLKNSFSKNGSSYDRKNPSKDYEEWLKIKDV